MSRALEALRAAMAAQDVHMSAAATSQASSMRELAVRARSRVMTGADYDALAALADAAARYGYPEPAADALVRRAAAVPASRASDPTTSKMAGAERVPSLRNQLGRLLIAYGTQYVTGEYPRMTSEQAAMWAGLSLRSEYAKRVSELQAAGQVRPVVDEDGRQVMAQGESGRWRLVFEATEAGRSLAARLVRQSQRG